MHAQQGTPSNPIQQPFGSFPCSGSLPCNLPEHQDVPQLHHPHGNAARSEAPADLPIHRSRTQPGLYQTQGPVRLAGFQTLKTSFMQYSSLELFTYSQTGKSRRVNIASAGFQQNYKLGSPDIKF